MRSIILLTATTYLLPLLLLLSIYLMLHGHDFPGGGFVGGLVASAAFALYVISRGAEESRKMIRVDPRVLIGAGLLGVLVLVGVLMVNFPSLPDVLGFQYNSDGIPVVVRSKSALFLLPIIGFLTWFVNALGGIWMSSRSQPTGAYMLWSGTLVVQACSLLAMISIIP